MYFQRIIPKITLVVLLMVCFLIFSPVIISSVSGTIYESENNNTWSCADITYDDYNCYGKILTTSDVDWWKVTFTTEGMANFYLGNIPSGCDYDLYVYKGNGETLVAKSLRSSNQYEIVRCRVYANTTYYIKIKSTIGSSSSYYLFRTKKYEMGAAYFFAYDYGTVNTYNAGYSVMNTIWGMGIGGNTYLDNNATPVWYSLPFSRINVIDTHGMPGYVQTNNTHLFANSNSTMVDGDRAISSFSYEALANNSLVVYAACKTGLTDSINNAGNLVDSTLLAGAANCIGWTDSIYTSVSGDWLNAFFNALSQGKTVYDAALQADYQIVYNEEILGIVYVCPTCMMNRYYGVPFFGLSTVFK